MIRQAIKIERYLFDRFSSEKGGFVVGGTTRRLELRGQSLCHFRAVDEQSVVNLDCRGRN